MNHEIDRMILIEESSTKMRDAGIPTIGLTATPFVKGLSDIYKNISVTDQRMDYISTTDQLIADGKLSPLKTYPATEVDLKEE